MYQRDPEYDHAVYHKCPIHHTHHIMNQIIVMTPNHPGMPIIILQKKLIFALPGPDPPKRIQTSWPGTKSTCKCCCRFDLGIVRGRPAVWKPAPNPQASYLRCYAHLNPDRSLENNQPVHFVAAKRRGKELPPRLFSSFGVRPPGMQMYSSNKAKQPPKKCSSNKIM